LDPPTWTGSWRDPRFSPPAHGGRPENALTGQVFTVNGVQFSDLKVGPEYGRMRLWRNTNLANLNDLDPPATLGRSILGYEWDEDLDNGSRPRGLVRLSSTTTHVNGRILDYGSRYGPGSATHTLTLYRHASDALVFGAGTIQWSWGLDSNHDNNAGAPVAGPDVRVQQATVNLFADMGIQPQTLQDNLQRATASSDAQAPTSRITSPPKGATVEQGRAITVAGTAADASGGVVGGVEVSVDGGVKWHPATGREDWKYKWVPKALGSTTIRVAAVDDSGNLEQPGASVTVDVCRVRRQEYGVMR
jgi:N,N-dimethylformamidase beta subunit-like, C-terminal/Bacterial Ig domain